MIGLDRIEVGIPFTPPRSLVRGIVVNAQGERFLNEDTYAGRLGQEFLLRQDGQVYFVHDDSTFAVNIAGYKPKWVAESAAELEERDRAAERLAPGHARPLQRGRPPRATTPTSTRPPSGSRRSSRPTAWWTCGWRRASTPRSPWAAWPPTPTAGCSATTGDPIPGLFAAGRTTAGIAAGGYVSGISLGDGTFFGRRAGAAAAARPG